MTLLSNTGILRHRALGSVVIEPFDEKALGNVSYDLTLGEQIARYHDAAQRFAPAVDLADEDPASMFEIEDAKTPWLSDRLGFHLDPGERVLAHSREVAGGRIAACPRCKGCGFDGPLRGLRCRECRGRGKFAVTTQLHATSTAARIGLQSCGCAGFGDVGFVSPWVFEVTNMSPRALWLPVGAVIAQVSFSEVEPPLDGTSYEQIGSYQKTADVDAIRAAWTLAGVLPKRLKVRT